MRLLAGESTEFDIDQGQQFLSGLGFALLPAVEDAREVAHTFVNDQVSPRAPVEAAKLLEPKVDSLLADAAHLKVTLPQVLALVRQRHENLKTKQAR